MNCCDDYGNCRQGRDCPIRAEHAEQPSPVRQLIIDLAACVVGVVWIGFIVVTVMNYIYGI